MWQTLQDEYSMTFFELLTIIDDALCHGFTFKVKNHKIFFKEN